MKFKSRLDTPEGNSVTVHTAAKTETAAAKQIARQVFGENIVVQRTRGNGGNGKGFRAFKRVAKGSKDLVPAGKCFHLKQVTA